MIPVVVAIAAFIFAFTATEFSPHFKEPVTIKTPVGPQLSIGYNKNNQLDITVSEVGYTIFDSQGSKPGFNFADSVSVTGSLTVSELIAGKAGLELTGGSLNLQGLGDSVIDAGGNLLTIDSKNLTVTQTGINGTAIGATAPSTGAFTTLSSTSTTNLATSHGALLTLGNAGADISVKGDLLPSGSVSIGSASNSFQSGYFTNLNTDNLTVANDFGVGGDLAVGGTVNGLSISGGVITIGTWQGSVVSPQYGGTGLSNYTAGDLVYASATDTLDQLNVGSNGNCLIVTAGMPAWGACAGVANTLQDTYNNGNQITTTNNRDIEITLADTATDSNFVVTTATGSTGGVAFVRANGAGAADPSQMLLIENQDTDRVLPIGLKIQSAAGGITTAIDLSDSDIVTAISAGANNLQGTFWSIDGSNGNFSTSGTITSGLVNGQTISSSANFTGSLTVANGFTVSAGSVTLPAGSISNAALANSSLTVTAGDALSGGGAVSLGGTITLNVNAGTNITTAGDQISVVDNPTFATSVTTPVVASTGSLSISSGGVGDLTLGSGSGTIKIAAGSDVLQRTDSGTFTIDLLDAGTTVLALDNTGAGTADFNIVSGGLQVVGTTVITNAKVLQNVTADASILTSGTLAVARGGTGSTAVGSAGSLAYSNGSAYAFSGVGTSGQVVLSGGTGAPTFTDIASIATTAVTAGTGLSGGGTVGGLTLNLANTAVSAGTYGSSTAVGQFTVDAQGRITAASNVTISGVAPGGSAGGDLSGTYPNPTVAKINGATLGSTTATAGNILIGSGTGWETRALSGDATLSSTGVLTVANGAITNAKLANSSLTVTAGDGISGGGAVSLGGTITLNVNAGTNITTAGDQVSVIDNPTFSGKVTGSASGATALELSGAPAASATSSLLQFGPAIAAGSANGTYIGINPAAFTGNFVDFQVGGTSAFKVSASGNLTATGTINGATISGGTLSGGTVSGGSLSATAVNGLSVSGGTISAGTWNGTAITDTYIADTLTIDSSSSVQWVALTGYPTACSAGTAVTAVGDTLTCTAFNSDTSISLQDAYSNGNTITTIDATDIDITLANTTTDANFTIDIATGSTGKFAVQSNGTDIFRVSAAENRILSNGLIIDTGGLTVSAGTVSLPAGQIDNAELANSSLTVTAGTGLSGGGSISLGGSATINLANTAVTAGSYGTASSVASFTVDAQGRLTAASDVAIAIAASQITSGTLGVARGGTGLSSYTIGDLIYADGATSLAKLAGVATGNVLISGGVATAPSWGKVVLGTHTTGNYVSSITGTANQVTASASTGDITLSLPQNIHTAATPTFGGLTVSNLTSGRVTFAGTAGVLTDSSAFTYTTATGQLALSTTGSGAGILIGGDVNLYRTATNVLAIPDTIRVGSDISTSVPDAGGTYVVSQIGSLSSSGYASVTAGVVDGTNNPRAHFFVDATNSAWGFRYVYSTGANYPFVVMNGAGEGLRIDGSNNVAFGTTTTSNGKVTIRRSTTGAALTIRNTGDSGNTFVVTDAGVVSTGTWNGTTIGVAYGGTNIASYTAGDLLYATGATTLAKLGIGASGTILSSNGSAPAWSTLSSLSVPTGTGTSNYVVKWTGTNTQGNSLIRDDGTSVGLGVAPSSARFFYATKTFTNDASTVLYGISSVVTGSHSDVTTRTYIGVGGVVGMQLSENASASVYGLYSSLEASYVATGKTNSGTMAGVFGYGIINSASHLGTVGSLHGGLFYGGFGSSAGSGTASAVYGLRTILLRSSASASITGSFFGLHIAESGSSTAVGGSRYGIYEALTNGGLNYFNNRLYVLGTQTDTAFSTVDLAGAWSTTVNAANSHIGYRVGPAPTVSTGVTNSGYWLGLYANMRPGSGHLGTVSAQYGAWMDYGFASSSGAGTITSALGININLHRSATGTIGTSYGIRLVETGSTTTVTSNRYGIYEAMSSGAFNYFANSVGIGATVPTQALHVAGSVRVTGGYYDSANSVGTSSQVLTGGATATWQSLSALSIPTGTGTNTHVTYWTGTNTQSGNAAFTFDAGTGQLALSTTGSGAGILIGGDTQIYRSAADLLRTPDSFTIDGTLLAGTYLGQTSITTLGTIGTGTWNGTAITDTYIADTLTVDASSSVQWTALTSYPSACTAGSAVTTIGDTLTCSAFGSVSGTGVADYTARWTGTSTLGTGVLRDDGTGVSIGTSPTTGRSLIVSRSATNQDSSTQVAIQGSGTGTATNNDNTRLLIGVSGSPAAVVTTISSTFNLDGFYAALGSSYVATGLTNAGTISGVRSQAFINTASHVGTLTLNVGGSFQAGLGSTATGNGFITSVYGIVSEGMFAGTGTITNYFGLRVVQSGTTAVVTNMYGLYEDLSASGSGGTPRNYLKNFLGIGITSPGDALHIGAGSVRITDLTASRLVSTDANKSLASVSNLTSWIAGTTNRLTATDDGDGTITLDISSSYVGQASITTLGTIGTGTWNGTTIGATYGGTGQSTWATGDLLYASASNTLAKRTIGSSGDILTVSGGLPTWASLSSLSIPSGTGTSNYVARWTGTNTLSTGLIRDDGSTVGIGTAPSSTAFTYLSKHWTNPGSSVYGFYEAGSMTISDASTATYIGGYFVNWLDISSSSSASSVRGLEVSISATRVASGLSGTGANFAGLFNANINNTFHDGTISSMTSLGAYFGFDSTADGGTVTTARGLVTQLNMTGIGTIGNAYSIYMLQSGSNTALSGNRYGIYEALSAGAFNYFANSVGINTTTPDRSLEILSSSAPQLRLTYTDASRYADFEVTSSGYLSLLPSGPGGNGRVGVNVAPSFAFHSVGTSGYGIFSDVDTNLATKQARIGVRSFDHSLQPFIGMYLASSGSAGVSTTNNLFLGGGTSSGSAATSTFFYNNTTVASGSGSVTAVLTNQGFIVGNGTPTARFTVQGDISSTAWTTSAIGIRYSASTFTDTSSSGTVAANYVHSLGVPTIAASNTTTYTRAYGLVVNEPAAGTNVTLTHQYALYAVGRQSRFDRVVIGRSGTNYGGIGENLSYVAGSAAWNYQSTDSAALLRFTNGGFQFFGAASGTADTAITFSQLMYIDRANGGVVIGTTSSAAALLQIGGSSTRSAWGLNGVGLRFDAGTYTDSSTSASGTVTNAVIHSFARPTIAASNSSVTVTNAATLYIANSPLAGTNISGITNAYAFWVDDGMVRFDGNVGFGGIAPVAAVDINGALVARSSGSLVTITADNQTVTTNDRTYIRLTSDNATATNRTFKLGAGVRDGQILVLEWTYTGTPYFGELLDNAGDFILLNGDWSPTLDDSITLIYNGSYWVELSRSSN